MKQIVRHKTLSPLRGFLLVIALIVILVILNYVVLNFVAALLGNTAAAVTFWVVGGLIALWMLRTYVVVYTYEIGDNILRLCRKYGKRERFIEDIYLNRVTYVGKLEEAKRRAPNAKVVKAVHSAVKTEKVAILFNASDGAGIAIIQPNEELREKLVAAARIGKAKS